MSFCLPFVYLGGDFVVIMASIFVPRVGHVSVFGVFVLFGSGCCEGCDLAGAGNGGGGKNMWALMVLGTCLYLVQNSFGGEYSKSIFVLELG